MSKKPRGALQRSVQERAREAAAKRIETASAIARLYADGCMKIIFPGEEVE